MLLSAIFTSTIFSSALFGADVFNSGAASSADAAPGSTAGQGTSSPQDDVDRPVEYSRELVKLNTVESYKLKGKNYVAINGEAPDVPTGAIVDFVLTFRSMGIDTFPFTMPDSKRIRVEFEVKTFPRSREKFYFRTIIASHKQSTKVKNAIKRAPKIFSPGLDPWTDHHHEKSFRLLTSAADAKQSIEPIRAFFRERLDRIAMLRHTAASETELAILGEKYASGDGSFDPGAWKPFLEDDTIEALLVIAEDARAALQQSRYIPFRRSLVALESSAKNGVLLCYQHGLRLFRSHGLAPPKEYISAASLELTRAERRRLQSFDLGAAEDLIKIELGIVKSDRVEEPFRLIAKVTYQGALFRHLTEEELENGKFDPIRSLATWTPTDEQIAEIETALAAHTSATDIAPRLADFRRQYVGLGAPTQRSVHISLIHRNSTVATSLIRTVQPASAAAQVVTVQYDMNTKKFSDLDQG